MSTDNLLKVTDHSVRTRLERMMLEVDSLHPGASTAVHDGCLVRWEFGERALRHELAMTMRRTGEPAEHESVEFELCVHHSQHQPEFCRQANRIASATRTRVRAECNDGRPTLITTVSTVKLGYVVSSSPDEHLALHVTTKHETTTERITRGHLDREEAKTATSRTVMVRSLDEVDAVLAEFLAYIS